MKERKRKLYRAVVTEAPEGQVPKWIYDRWNSPDEPKQLAELRSRELSYHGAGRVEIDPYSDPREYLVTFKAGKSRTFHNRASAERKARLWRANGCKVRIDESPVIEWIEGEAS